MLVFMGTPEKHFSRGKGNEFDVRSSDEKKKDSHVTQTCKWDSDSSRR